MEGSTEDRSSWPEHYVSLRLTIDHDKWPKILRTVCREDSYVAFPHTADAGTKKPHWHLFFPMDEATTRDVDRFRKRAKDGLGLSGNATISAKAMHNGILCAIQYGSKEGTRPKFSPDMEAAVASAPAWVQSTISVLPDDLSTRKDRDWQLNYPNLVTQAVYHHRKHGLAITATLREVVKHMIENTKWRPSYQLVNNGIPKFFQNDFEVRIGRPGAKTDMTWFEHQLR